MSVFDGIHDKPCLHDDVIDEYRADHAVIVRRGGRDCILYTLTAASTTTVGNDRNTRFFFSFHFTLFYFFLENFPPSGVNKKKKKRKEINRHTSGVCIVDDTTDAADVPLSDI